VNGSIDGDAKALEGIFVVDEDFSHCEERRAIVPRANIFEIATAQAEKKG